jgi:hypothetical protein
MRDLGTSERDTDRKVDRSRAGRQARRREWVSPRPTILVIRLEAPSPALTAAERFGWEVLLDASRLLCVDGGAADRGGAVATPPLGFVTVRVAPDEHRSTVARMPQALIDTAARGFDVAADVVVVPRLVLRAVTDLAGAAAEQRSTARDRHGRVPASENPLAAAGHERQPVVSLAAIAFRAAVQKAAGRRPFLSVAPWPEDRRWAAAFTHDVDVVAAWPLFTGLRVAELARKGLLPAAATVVAAAARSIGRNPVAHGVRGVLDIERRARVQSTWFILCGTPTWKTFRQGDLTYRPESRRARTVIGAARASGHELALHGSFVTMDRGSAFIEQRERLGRIAGVVPTGVRQHFLRMRPGETQRAMAAAQFSYDATYGFSDRNGFRLGVADVVPSWDAASATPAALDEVPLVWMDRAQSKYQGIEDPARWVEDARELAGACRAAEGMWVGLWHPNLTPPLGYPAAPEAYERLVTSIIADEPYVASLERLVAWRRLRRSVRVVGVRGNRAVVGASSTRAFDIAIVDGEGHSVATLPADQTSLNVEIPLR